MLLKIYRLKCNNYIVKLFVIDLHYDLIILCFDMIILSFERKGGLGPVGPPPENVYTVLSLGPRSLRPWVKFNSRHLLKYMHLNLARLVIRGNVLQLKGNVLQSYLTGPGKGVFPLYNRTIFACQMSKLGQFLL
jgi:hypothetical protein